MARVEHSLTDLEKRIGITVSNKARLERALTHASLKAGSTAKNYERLEFLGDRVLGLVIAERLFEMFPHAAEGDLSLRLNSLVSADACADIAEEIGLADFIRHGGDVKRIKGSQSKNIRADVVEALIAAIYLDGGLDAARDFIERFWKSRLAGSSAARRDAKTALQEWAHLKTTETPRYEVVDRTGPDHDPMFTVRVVIDGVKPGEGAGRSKRLAEQDAATAVLLREGVWKDET
ncbi:ribonuclease III [Consotaella salsifontis]|uniref:Ribonuclease 3 n=1 Tax=Consotaella salsifontis TaxID=1365950 RepID=A0A1T4T6G9_9HYPH|nr:RNAse III [Consotaella salsifontis]